MRPPHRLASRRPAAANPATIFVARLATADVRAAADRTLSFFLVFRVIAGAAIWLPASLPELAESGAKA